VSERTTIHVATASPYDVVIGTGVLDAVTDFTDGVRRVALVRPETLDVPFLGDLDVLDLAVPEGEAAKTAAVVADCWERLGAAGFTRSDLIITLGGGSTTDVGGFVAATWLRGVAVVHLPSTLLAMVDAAVGGKTGINTSVGKNLVGSFHEPTGVVCDLGLLASLPHEELVSGMGEIVKCGFIADPEILRLAALDDALDPSSATLRELVERAIRVKAAVVADDLEETGGREGHPGREVLNYGHTLGHAIERATGYGIRHGEAVALGMVFVAELARSAGRLDDATARLHETSLAGVGLPTRWDDASFDDLLATMRVDKKTRGDLLRFVVLDGLGRPGILEGPAEDQLRAAYDHLSGRGGR
jgi:3-dehydroquinate synthase